MSELLPGWGRGEQDTVVAALQRAISRVPDRVLFDFSGATYTYRQVDRLTNRLAHALADLGAGPGETVVTMLDNNIDAVVAWLGISKACAVSVPLNTALRGEFLRHQAADAGASIMICEADYLARILAVAEGLPEAKLILYRGQLDEKSSRLADVAGNGRLKIEAFDEYRGSDDSALTRQPSPEDLGCLIYTSGTTGPSKGCMVSFNYMANLARQKLRGGPATQDDVTFTPLPLFHLNAVVSGCTTTILVGGRIALAPRFSVSGFWPEIERSGATIASILGSMAQLLAQASDNEAMKRCFGQVHTVRGNPIVQEVREVWQQRFGARHVGSSDYGLTEAAVVTSLFEGEYATAPPGSSGRRNPEFDVRIVDDEDNELPPGQAGEIVVRPLRSHVMFDGYWRRPADTLKVMRNLWFHSGDIGKFDEAGNFYFIDRKKDYLRRRGENISSFEMEATFHGHPDIQEVAVHAVFSPVGEDDVKVTAVLRPGSSLTEEALCRWAIDQVPYYAVPRFIEFRDHLPKNPQGRVLKYQLREEGRTQATWDLEENDIVVSRH